MTVFDLNSYKQVELIDELPFWSAPFGVELLNGVKLRKNISALDIGYGLGFPLTEIAMRLGKTCKVYGIDPWETATQRVRKKLDFYGIKNVELFEGQAENIPLPDASIDLITSNNGVNNISDLDAVLTECHRVMKSGAQFIQTMNLESSMNEFYDVMKMVLQSKGMDSAVQNMFHQISHKRKPLTQVRKQLEKHNFNIMDLKHHHFEYRFVDGTTLLDHYFIRLAFLDDWKSIVPEEDQEEVFYRIEEGLNQIAIREGGIKLTIPFVVIDCEKN